MGTFGNFGRGTTLLKGATNGHDYLIYNFWDDPPTIWRFPGGLQFHTLDKQSPNIRQQDEIDRNIDPKTHRKPDRKWHMGPTGPNDLGVCIQHMNDSLTQINLCPQPNPPQQTSESSQIISQ